MIVWGIPDGKRFCLAVERRADRHRWHVKITNDWTKSEETIYKRIDYLLKHTHAQDGMVECYLIHEINVN